MSSKQEQFHTLLRDLNATRKQYDAVPPISHQARKYGAKMLRLVTKLRNHHQIVFELYGQYYLETMLDEKIQEYRTLFQTQLLSLREVAVQYATTHHPQTAHVSMHRFALHIQRETILHFFFTHGIHVREEQPGFWVFTHLEDDLQAVLTLITSQTLFQAVRAPKGQS